MINVNKEEQKIKRLPYSRMLKSEVSEYALQTLSIVSAHSPAALLENPVYKQFMAQAPQIEMLRLNYGVDTMRYEVSNLKAELMLAISAFKLSVRQVKWANPGVNLSRVENAINSNLRYLNQCRNDKELHHKVAGFFKLIGTDAEVGRAISELNLTDQLNAMEEKQTAFNEAWLTRVSLLAKRHNVSTLQIIRSVTWAIDNLLIVIDAAHLVNTLSEGTAEGDTEAADDYTALVNELNKLSQMFYRSINVRYNINKRKAEKDKEDSLDSDEPMVDADEPVEGDASTEVETTTMNGNGAGDTVTVFNAPLVEMMERPSGQSSTIDSGNGSLKRIDKEKAVDSRWGSSQQPFDNDNA